jgi:hypothetical protein
MPIQEPACSFGALWYAILAHSANQPYGFELGSKRGVVRINVLDMRGTFQIIKECIGLTFA